MGKKLNDFRGISDDSHHEGSKPAESKIHISSKVSEEDISDGVIPFLNGSDQRSLSGVIFDNRVDHIGVLMKESDQIVRVVKVNTVGNLVFDLCWSHDEDLRLVL